MKRINLVWIASLFALASPSCSREGAGALGAGGMSPGSGGSAAETGGTSAAGGRAGAGGHAGGSGAGGHAGGSAAPSALPALVTSAPGAYWKIDGKLIEVTSDVADMTVEDGTVGQLWEGFGGTFSERGGDCLSMLSPSDRETALNLLFGQDGLRFNRGRIPIGASDYAVDRYSLDETPDDLSMSKFSIERDKQRLIPFIKAALAVAPGLHLWASPWSPPTWMKSNGAFDGGSMKEDEATLQAFALYLSKFVQEYGKEGIPIEVLHPQKEPNLELDFPSCRWSASAMAKFIGVHLGPTLSEQKSAAQIYLGSLSEDDRAGRALAIVSAVMGDAAASSYVKGFGFEWDGLNLLAGVKARNLPVWQNNHNVGNIPWGSGSAAFNAAKAPNDHAYAVASWKFLRDWIRGGVTAYFTSNMILDSVGLGLAKQNWPQNALLVVDTTTKKLVVTPAFHLFRHLSSFVAPGARVMGTSGDLLAFKNPDGTTVAVVFNAGEQKMVTVALGGKKLQFELPANGWATVRSQ